VYIGEQLINPTNERLRLSTRLGCEGIVIDTHANRDVCNDDGTWNVARLNVQKARIERFAIKHEGMALDVRSILIDSLCDPPNAKKIADRLRQNIRMAGAISEAEGWRAIEFLVHSRLPTATKAKVILACHPHDPADPPGGLNGVLCPDHVPLSDIDLDRERLFSFSLGICVGFLNDDAS